MKSKLIVGLDIGVNSVGFAIIKEPESGEPQILKMGVRIVNEDPNFHLKFYQGNSASRNADRRTNRGIRRGTDRYQLRRTLLTEILQQYNMMPDEDLMLKVSALELYGLRAKAAVEMVTLPELGRIFFHLNQKRGYSSMRKGYNPEESDSEYLARIQELHEEVEFQTIGQYCYKKLQKNPLYRLRESTFLRTDYQREFDAIWNEQKKHYPSLLTGGPEEKDNRGTLYRAIRNEIIYYQRPLKSAKHLVSNCTFEPYKKVIPKSHPLFQSFRIWQVINNLVAKAYDGEEVLPTEIQRLKLFEELHLKRKISATGILKIMGLKNGEYTLNYEEIPGNLTWINCYLALKEIGEETLMRSWLSQGVEYSEQHPFVKYWHITYSLETEKDVIHALQSQLNFTETAAVQIAKKIGYTNDYGSLSSKAIRRILPHLLKGLTYDKAVLEAKYEHHSNIYNVTNIKDILPPVLPNTLRNPVVEQILNQVVNVVNTITDRYGKPDEFRIEMARELKSNAKKRKRVFTENNNRKKQADEIIHDLKERYGFKRVNMRDVQRWRLWEETDQMCLYCTRHIKFEDVYKGNADIEHIIPRSRIFSDAHTNFILAHTSCNRNKGQMTAYDYMASKPKEDFEAYLSSIAKLFKLKKISTPKRDNLLMKGDEIPSDFLNRQLNDTQYVARETIAMLKQVCKNVYTTTGSVTDLLKEKWNLKHVLEEVNMETYREAGLTNPVEVLPGKIVEKITNWEKRKDHRHHALDALAIALTKQSYIQRLNTLSANYLTYQNLKESPYDFPAPIKDMRKLVTEHLNGILVSFKKPNSKLLTKKTNKIKLANGKTATQETWVPRGSLHNDTIMGRIKRYKKTDWKEALENPGNLVSVEVKTALLEFVKSSGDAKKALTTLKKEGLNVNGAIITQPLIWDYVFTKRVKLSEQLTTAQITKIADTRIKRLVEQRVKEAGSIKAAFKDYASNPIYLNENKRIPIKTVTVEDRSSLVPVRTGYAVLGNNHHAIIYKDATGKFTEKIVSFWEVVESALQNWRTTGKIYPVINTNPDPEKGEVYMTLQINDLFLIELPEELKHSHETNQLTPYIYRLQKLSAGDYVFRHQYQTNLELELPFAMKRIQSLSKFTTIQKVQINALGEIIRIA
ncbi:MAG: type II CRISPR RNA-guided endonuclease Cas9 [Bacteroidetes bacterium]|nr:type II CRISPR RNA-guided endonuclease Cas9 [Bacteroidota bacterium]